jgi:predicted nucleic acid-binding protein
MRKQIYIDTTIPSFYHEIRTDAESVYKRNVTRGWWDTESHKYDIFISDLVWEEIERGNYPTKQELIEFISDIPILEPAEELLAIVQTYLQNQVMPSRDIGDAFHLAYASFYKMDYLLTWNCKHLANANKTQYIRLTNISLGLFIPMIVIPEQLFMQESEEIT